ncbi:MAG: peptidyl-prolyl cis-trans isomerase, partial [Arcobacteraceae bacterium]
MKKLFISVLMCASLAHAGLVDAVALTVNNDAITLYDIEAKAAQTKGDKNAAVSMLIDELLYEQELQKHNISVSLFDINEYLERVAASNGLELYAFKAIIKQKYEDYSVFEEETRKRILQEKLVQKLVRGNIKIATQEDLEI